MKIAVWHNLPSGGGKRALYDHVRGLIKRGHQVEAWCPPTAGASFLPLGDLITEHVIPLSLPKKMEKRLEAMEEHCRRCALEINAGGFDLLFAGTCTFFRTTPIAKYVRIPKTIYLGEPYRWLYEALPQLPWKALPSSSTAWWKPSGFKLLIEDRQKIRGLRIQMREEIANAAAFDRILVNSLFSRESVLRAYGLDARVCYLGIDTELFRPSGSSRENFAAGLGSIYFGKGIDRAIRAIGTIEKSKRPNLIWIGNFSDKNYQKEMERLAAALGVTVSFKVLIPDAEVTDILSRAAALIYTSRLEPFGLAVLEANACGTPVIGIAEGGVRETVLEGINGFLVSDEDPAVMGQAILKLSGDPALSSEKGLKARRHVVEHWNLEQSTDRLEKQLILLQQQFKSKAPLR